MRWCSYLYKFKKNVVAIVIRRLSLEVLRFLNALDRFHISPQTGIGHGLYMSHCGNIAISDDVKIGNNCNISQNVTIGQTNRGNRQGCPVIGDNVYIGPGAAVIGGIQVGNNVAIGANAVVTKDVPDNAVVVGNPGRVISYEGSTGYINNTDYQHH
jgi:serine O-acetyltransferase